MHSLNQLVPDRDCGTCNQCCIVPAIDKPEIQKLPSAACAHCTVTGGCDIYQTRPVVCREYFCGWRRLGLLGEAWRPDKSGVLVEVGQGASLSLSLTLIANPLKTVREQRFIDFISLQVSRGTGVYLGLPGPKGMLGATLLLNGPELKAAALHSRSAVKAFLENALKRLQAHDFQPAALEYSGHDVTR